MTTILNADQIAYLDQTFKGIQTERFRESFVNRTYGDEHRRFIVPLFFDWSSKLALLRPEDRKELFDNTVKCNSSEMQLVIIGDVIEENRLKRKNKMYSIENVYNPFFDLLSPDTIKDNAKLFAILTAIATCAVRVFSKSADSEPFVEQIIEKTLTGFILAGTGTVLLGLVGELGAVITKLVKSGTQKISNVFSKFDDQCSALESLLKAFEDDLNMAEINRSMSALLEKVYNKNEAEAQQTGQNLFVPELYNQTIN